MKRILTAVVLIPVVLGVVFKAPLWIFAAVASIFALIALYEYLELARHFDSAVPVVAGMAQASLIFALLTMALRSSDERSGISSTAAIAVLIVLYPLLLFAGQMRLADFRSAVLSTALATFAVPYVVIPFACLILVRSFANGWFFILWLFFMVWSGDIFAYYVGKNFGKNLIAPRVSPKKTWEGTIASVVGSAAVSWLLCANVGRIEVWLRGTGILPSDSIFGSAAILQSPPTWVPIVLAIVINVVSQLGDLAESMLKRAANVKDSGTVLPGHGGMLDRVDALLFAAPVGMLLFQVTRQYLYPR
ncbi:MAG TPA: phosphatidate cytidylyltransferase [Terriglobales bacterium]|nr:phosphatidate cytidylyltransferase [Terriglobales bacterium]